MSVYGKEVEMGAASCKIHNLSWQNSKLYICMYIYIIYLNDKTDSCKHQFHGSGIFLIVNY